MRLEQTWRQQHHMDHLCASDLRVGECFLTACLAVSQDFVVDSQLMQQGAVQLRQTHSIVYGLIACFVCRAVAVPPPLKPPFAKNSGQGTQSWKASVVN